MKDTGYVNRYGSGARVKLPNKTLSCQTSEQDLNDMPRGNKTGKGGFKKGHSGNPGGRKPQDPLIKEFKETTYKDFINGLQKYGRMSFEEMHLELSDPNATMFDLIFGKIVANAANGDKDARQVLLERLWGKVKESVDIHHDPERDKLRNMSNAELHALVKGILQERDEG